MRGRWKFCPPPKNMKDKERGAICPKCRSAYAQTPATLKEWNTESDGWDARIVWVPAHCPPCERRSMPG